MKKIKSFEEFVQQVEENPELLEKLKNDPMATLKEIPISGPIYTQDKLVYRMVVGGFVGVLFFGMIYFIYQYERSIQVRTEYSMEVLRVFEETKPSNNMDSAFTSSKLLNLSESIVGPDKINGTAPDGIIAVFTGIIGALAGLFAPSPFSRNKDS